MGQPLDAIIREDMIGSRDQSGTNYETINSTGTSEVIDVSGSEQGYLVSLDYVDGAGGVNILFSIDGSDDGISFSPIDDVTVTDNSGNIIWDVTNSNANYVRIKWTVTSGTLDIYGRLSAKRRH